MKKIDILTLHLGVGGIEEAVCNLANMLSSDYKVRIIAVHKHITPHKINKNVEVNFLIDSDAASLGNKLKGNLFKNIWNLYIKKGDIIRLIIDTLRALKVLFLKGVVIKKYLKISDADVKIVTNMYLLKKLNKYGKGIKIYQEHGDHTQNIKYLKTIKKYTKNIDYVIPVSKFIKNKYQTILNTKVIYGPLCVDYIAKENNSLDTLNLVSIGRLAFEKGFDDLIYIMKDLVKINKNIKLHLVGDGYLYQDLHDKIEELGLENNIIMYGDLDKKQIHKILKNASLYLMTSKEESFGLVLLEAFSFGIPAISFDRARGAKEIITNNKDGYLIKNSDTNLYAKKVIDILNDKKSLKKLGNNAYQKSLDFSYENIKKIWLSIIEDIFKMEE